MEEVRRCGAHEIVVDGDTTLTLAVVEILADKVVNYYEFRDELPMTEWLGGRIEIKRDEEGILRAYHMGRRLSSMR